MAISKLSTTASLKQVMDKFEEISLQDFSSIDIITASELPAKVKEGQIVIITQNTPNKIYVSLNSKKIDLNSNDILLQVSIQDENKKSLYCGDKEICLTYKACIQNENYLESYYGENGEWIQITYTKNYILRNGEVEMGNFLLVGGMNGDTLLNNGKLNLKVNGTFTAYGYVANNKYLDLSMYSKLFVKISSMILSPISSSWLQTNNYIEFGIANDASGSGFYSVKQNYTNTTSSKTYNDLLVEIDISKVNNGYFLLKSGYQGTSSYNEIHITDIYMV